MSQLSTAELAFGHGIGAALSLGMTFREMGLDMLDGQGVARCSSKEHKKIQ